MRMPELKPCPFCGGEADLAIQNFAFETAYVANAYCTDCGCTITKHFRLPTWTKSKPEEVRQRMAKIWNGRVNNG
jgi:hypothetical protein